MEDSMSVACVTLVAVAFVILVFAGRNWETDPYTALSLLEFSKHFEHINANRVCNRTILRLAPLDHVRFQHA